MNNELRELYQEIIIEHARSPHHFCALEHPSHTAEGYNPLCGDKITVFLQIVDDKIADISFQGNGCAISQSSASMMTDALIGKSTTDALSLFETFHDVLVAPTDAPPPATLGKLAVLAGVKEFPMRVKCATLAWHTFKNALQAKSVVANTEKEED